MVPNDIRLPHRASHGAKWLACRTRLIRKLAPGAFTPYSGIGAFAGVGLALGVLMDTFIVRTVLVPCTVLLLGRWNW
jgi:hypothetical protein